MKYRKSTVTVNGVERKI